MNRCVPANITHSVHQRPLVRARHVGRPFNELRQYCAGKPANHHFGYRL